MSNSQQCATIRVHMAYHRLLVKLTILSNILGFYRESSASHPIFLVLIRKEFACCFERWPFELNKLTQHVQNSTGTNTQTSLKTYLNQLRQTQRGHLCSFMPLLNQPIIQTVIYLLIYWSPSVGVKARDNHEVGSIDRMTFQNKLNSAQEMNYLDVKGLRDILLK